jgi:hypothetical protein
VFWFASVPRCEVGAYVLRSVMMRLNNVSHDALVTCCEALNEGEKAVTKSTASD